MAEANLTNAAQNAFINVAALLTGLSNFGTKTQGFAAAVAVVYPATQGKPVGYRPMADLNAVLAGYATQLRSTALPANRVATNADVQYVADLVYRICTAGAYIYTGAPSGAEAAALLVAYNTWLT